MRNFKERMETNNKSISTKAFILMLERAATSSGTTINGDLRLDRMIEALKVVFKCNALDSIIDLQRDCLQLQLYRQNYIYKPHGFDSLVDNLMERFADVCLDAGFGTHQMAQVSYLIPIDLLTKMEVDFLRGMVA